MKVVDGEDVGCTRDIQKEYRSVSATGVMPIDLRYGCPKMSDGNVDGC